MVGRLQFRPITMIIQVFELLLTLFLILDTISFVIVMKYSLEVCVVYEPHQGQCNERTLKLAGNIWILHYFTAKIV